MTRKTSNAIGRRHKQFRCQLCKKIVLFPNLQAHLAKHKKDDPKIDSDGLFTRVTHHKANQCASEPLNDPIHSQLDDSAIIDDLDRYVDISVSSQHSASVEVHNNSIASEKSDSHQSPSKSITSIKSVKSRHSVIALPSHGSCSQCSMTMPKADFEKHAQSDHPTQKAYYQPAYTPDAGDADDADAKARVIATGTDKRAATLGLDQLCNTYEHRATPVPPQEHALGLTPLPLPSWTMTPRLLS
jgi:hypothetical protein